MLVNLRSWPVTLAVVTLFAAPSAARAADRAVDRDRGGWTQAAFDAASIPREKADEAFAAPNAGDTDPTRPIARVDESALRYYASQHATSRVEAEIRRLRALYPGWEPPADLYKPGAGDEQALWDLYGKNRIDDLKLEIERRAARQPGWRPSPDMVEKLRRKELRNELVAASDRADWSAVLALVERDPILVGPTDLDVMWRLAEARARTGNEPGAIEIYRAALAGARDVAERQGTVRKALAVLGSDRTAPLLAEERTGPDGKGEFEPVRLDLARARLGEWLRPDARGTLPEADLARLTPIAGAATGVAGDATLLGWVEHKRGNAAAASRWFATALARGDAKAALGAVLSAEAGGRHEEAIDLAMTHGDDAEVGALFLDLVAGDLTRPHPPALAAPRLARYAALAEKLESGDAAQALAWYALAARQNDAARAWFVKAMAWRPSAKTAEGHLIAVRALGDRAALEKLTADYRGRFPDLPSLEKLARPEARTASAPARRSCRDLLATRPTAGADVLATGWCLLDAKRNEEAALAFEAARRGVDGRAAGEAAYGQALAHLRSGRSEDAARIAAAGGLPPERREEIGRIVLAQQAIALFERSEWSATLATLDRRRAHVAEPRDLMTMRAWALYHLGRRSESFDLFAQLDGQMSTAETRAGLAAAGTIPGRRT